MQVNLGILYEYGRQKKKRLYITYKYIYIYPLKLTQFEFTQKTLLYDALRLANCIFNRTGHLHYYYYNRRVKVDLYKNLPKR